MSPLVSIITPTWRRHELLNERCIPSVQNQTYSNIEHIIVSDGPDPELAEQFRSSAMPEVCQDMRQGRRHPVWYYELAEHDCIEHWGTYARLYGIELAAGDLIGYCDDDDALRPDHVKKLVVALEANPECGFAYSLMEQNNDGGGATTIGQGPLCCGNIGTPMVMHRRSVLEHGTWGDPGPFEDWELVNKWLHAGVRNVPIGEVTVDVWPSIFFGPGR